MTPNAEKNFGRTIERREQNDGDLATAQRLIAQHDTIELGSKSLDLVESGRTEHFSGSALRQAIDVVDFSISRGLEPMPAESILVEVKRVGYREPASRPCLRERFEGNLLIRHGDEQPSSVAR